MLSHRWVQVQLAEICWHLFVDNRICESGRCFTSMPSKQCTESERWRLICHKQFHRKILRCASNQLMCAFVRWCAVCTAVKHELRNRLRIVHKLPNNGLMICVLIYFIIQLRRYRCLTMTTTCRTNFFSSFVLYVLFLFKPEIHYSPDFFRWCILIQLHARSLHIVVASMHSLELRVTQND